MAKNTASKRDAMVDATLRLLRGSGLAGASLNRALEESGAPKGSLYHYFPGGKDELVEAALQRFADDFSQLLESHWLKKAPFEERWTGLVQSMARGLRRSDFSLGCPVAATLLDLDKIDHAVRQVANAILDRWIDVLATGMPELPRDRRRSFAGSLLAMLEGALILSRAQQNEGPLLATKDFGIAAYVGVTRGKGTESDIR